MTNKVGSRSKDPVKTPYSTQRETNKYWATVINSASDEGMHKDKSVMEKGADDNT